MDYKKLYFYLFNQITDALEELEHDKYMNCIEILKEAQIYCEELYISSTEETDNA